MFKRYSTAEKNAAMRDYCLRTKEQGKGRFIWREVLASVLFWLILTPALYIFEDRTPYWSVRSMVFADLTLLPIFLLGGYLTGRWRWNDLEKKYPNDSLPHWE